MDLPSVSHEGGWTCRAIRYRLTSDSMIVHCCHCRWCQRETGASFALNAMIEASRVVMLAGEPEVVDTPSNSGKGVGTLDEPDRLPPGHPHLHVVEAALDRAARGRAGGARYYKSAEVWSKDSLDRRAAGR